MSSFVVPEAYVPALKRIRSRLDSFFFFIIRAQNLVALSVAINTCEYCVETLPLLQQTLDAHSAMLVAAASASSSTAHTNAASSAPSSSSSSSLAALTIDAELEAFQLLLHKSVMCACACVTARLQRVWNTQMVRRFPDHPKPPTPPPPTAPRVWVCRHVAV